MAANKTATIATVAKEVTALHKKFDNFAKPVLGEAVELVSLPWWRAHLGWAVACAVCLVVGYLVALV